MKGDKYIGSDEADQIAYQWLNLNGIVIRDNDNYENGVFLETSWNDPSCILGTFYAELSKDIKDNSELEKAIKLINTSFTTNKPETNVFTPNKEQIDLILSVYENDLDKYQEMGFNSVEAYQWGVKIDTQDPSIGHILYKLCKNCQIYRINTTPNVISNNLIDPKSEKVYLFIPSKIFKNYDQVIRDLKTNVMKSKDTLKKRGTLNKNEQLNIDLEDYKKSNSILLISKLIDLIPDVVRSDVFSVYHKLPQTRANWIEELYALFALATNLPPDNPRLYRAFDEERPYSIAKIIAGITKYTHNNARDYKQVGNFLTRYNLISEANFVMDKLSAFEATTPGVIQRTPFYGEVMKKRGD